MKKVISIITMMALVMVMLSACASSTTAVTVGDQEVAVGQATFVLRELEAMYEQQYGTEIWNQGSEGTNTSDIVKDDAISTMTRLYISKEVAEKNDVALSEEEITATEGLITEYLTYVSEDVLAEDGITVDDVRAIFMMNALGEKLMDDVLIGFEVDQAAIDEALVNDQGYQYIQENGIEAVIEELARVTVQHVLITTIDDEGIDYTEEQKEEALALAEEVLAKAIAGDPFDGLVADYSEDPSAASNSGIFTFGRGEMVSEFEEASYNMEIGDVELVESDYGFHIISKMDHIMPTDDDVKMVEGYSDTMVEQYTLLQKQEAYNAIYAEWALDYEVVVNEKVWDEVKTSYQMVMEGLEAEE